MTTPATTSKRNGLAIGGFVVSLVGLILGLSLYGGILGLIGLILSIVGRRQVDARGQRGRGLATAGIILGAIAVVLTIVVLILAATHPATH